MSRPFTNGPLLVSRFTDGGDETTGDPTFPTYITAVNSDGSGAQDLTVPVGPNPHDLAPAGFGTKVAYFHFATYSPFGTNGEIHTVNLDGTGDALIYSSLTNESFTNQGLGLAWNLDGTKLAALYWDSAALGGSGAPGIMVTNADGSGVAKVILDPSLEGSDFTTTRFDWFDNTHLLMGKSAAHLGLVLIGLDGAITQTITDGSTTSDYLVGILPDDDLVIWRVSEFGRIHPDGTGYASLFTPSLPSGFDSFASLALSPDGASIAALLRPSGPPYSVTPITQLGIYGIDGSGPTGYPLIPQEIDIGGVSWAPAFPQPAISVIAAGAQSTGIIRR